MGSAFITRLSFCRTCHQQPSIRLPTAVMASPMSFGEGNSGFQAGIINGPVSTEFHLPPERPETPPDPSAFVPFSQDHDFIERDLLDQIHRKCAVPGSRTALVGLGGVGKSQLAIEYAYRTRERSPNTWVFWVHASNAARFENSYRDIANFLKLPGRKNPKANIFQLVHDWLRDERRVWVLILDNVDDAGFFLKSYGDGGIEGEGGLNSEGSRPLESYLPRCQNGAVLVTTRSRSAALELVERRDIIAVQPMSKADAVALLEKKLEGIEESDGVSELATALEFMPLAMVQATSYIAHRAPRCSVRQYLEEFRKSDRKKASLLDFEKGQLRRDRDAKNSIIITWQLSFDHIRQTKTSAAELLSLMSFFDRQGIPEDLIRNRNEQSDSQENQGDHDSDALEDINTGEDSDDNSADDNRSKDGDDKFEDDILTLRDYSFISITGSGSSFEMHGLVQLATRKWLEAHGQREKWKRQFLVNLSSKFPTGKYENWAICQVLFPHAKSAVTQKPEGQESLKMWATILYRAAWYAEQVGNGVDAEEMSITAMRARKKVFGREHEDTLWSMSLVGGAYNLRGRWGAAESLFVQVMETRKSKLGVDHPSTLTSMANLAWNQGRWEEAESLFVQVMETSKSKLGADHPSTLTSMNNLAVTYSMQGREDKAEELKMQVMETSKSKLGVDHPDTLTSMNNLAFTFKGKGDNGKAIRLMEQCIRKQKYILGPDHPYTKDSEDALNSWRIEGLGLGSCSKEVGNTVAIA
ncbi:TPR-like protein [Lindgomyces ingoldianus]|uniref:TPR-like protein n=1 Tax=Lindgomyces ingoldianus TaxID=673940 RepID=A0ACB6QC59_9PLEO|nr:TPR-like protein [Lindgomyces ingoldianus]KAF2464492.1 TPR-like protein [Lindgomyces ingoldianus]